MIHKIIDVILLTPTKFRSHYNHPYLGGTAESKIMTELYKDDDMAMCE